MQNLAQFKQQLKPYKAIIGFDYGSKRLGVAVSDLLLTVATPYAIWQRSDFAKDLAYIQKVIAEKEVGAIVFGLPLQMNGEEGDIAKEVRAFADKLAEHIAEYRQLCYRLVSDPDVGVGAYEAEYQRKTQKRNAFRQNRLVYHLSGRVIILLFFLKGNPI